MKGREIQVKGITKFKTDGQTYSRSKMICEKRLPYTTADTLKQEAV